MYDWNMTWSTQTKNRARNHSVLVPLSKQCWVNMHMIRTHQLARCFFTFFILLFRVETSCCHSGRTAASSQSFTSLLPDLGTCSICGRGNRCIFRIWTPKDDARGRISILDSTSRLKRSRFKLWLLQNHIFLFGRTEIHILSYLHASKNISFALSRNHVWPNRSVWKIRWTARSKALLAPKPKRKTAVCIRNLQWVVFN